MTNKFPEWIWYCEEENGNRLVTFGRWPKNPEQKRYKFAEVQPTEHDHKKSEFISVPKELLAMVLDQAEDDSYFLGFEWRWNFLNEENKKRFNEQRENINKLRNLTGIE